MQYTMHMEEKDIEAIMKLPPEKRIEAITQMFMGWATESNPEDIAEDAEQAVIAAVKDVGTEITTFAVQQIVTSTLAPILYSAPITILSIAGRLALPFMRYSFSDALTTKEGMQIAANEVGADKDLWFARVSFGSLRNSTYHNVIKQSGESYHIGFTGHRESKNNKNLYKRMTNIFEAAKKKKGGVEFHHGGAQGADLISAEAAIDSHVEIHTHLPFPFDVTTQGWNQTDKDRLQRIIIHSKEVTVERLTYDVRGYFERNQRIIDQSKIMTTNWDERVGGGTYDTVKKAKQQGKIVIQSETYTEVDASIPSGIKPPE